MIETIWTVAIALFGIGFALVGALLIYFCVVDGWLPLLKGQLKGVFRKTQEDAQADVNGVQKYPIE